MNKIIIEGIDGIGKSTLINRFLSEQPQYKKFIIKNQQYAVDLANTKIKENIIISENYFGSAHFTIWDAILKETMPKDSKMIFDRSIWSFLAYQEIVDGECPTLKGFVRDTMKEIENRQQELGIKIIFINAEESDLKEIAERNCTRPNEPHWARSVDLLRRAQKNIYNLVCLIQLLILY